MRTRTFTYADTTVPGPSLLGDKRWRVLAGKESTYEELSKLPSDVWYIGSWIREVKMLNVFKGPCIPLQHHTAAHLTPHDLSPNQVWRSQNR